MRPLMIALLLLLPRAALGAELLGGDEAVLPAGRVVEDDLYVAGGDVRIAGTVRGDLIVAGGEVAVEGEVTGDLIAASGTLLVTGRVDGTIRAAAGQAHFAAPVGGDLVVAAGEVQVQPTAGIGRDLLASGGRITVEAPVARRGWIGAGEAAIHGSVGGDLHAAVRTLEVGAVTIAGDLLYPEDAEAEIAPEARIQGQVIRTEPIARGPGIARRLWGIVRTLVGLWALGALFILAAPRWSERAAAFPRRRPGGTVLAGLGTLLLAPFFAVVAFAVGLVTGGWWIGLILLGLYAIAIALALPIAGRALGGAVARRFHKDRWRWPITLLVGVLVLSVLFAVPILGALVGVVAVLFGLGGLVLGQRHGHESPAPPPV